MYPSSLNSEVTALVGDAPAVGVREDLRRRHLKNKEKMSSGFAHPASLFSAFQKVLPSPGPEPASHGVRPKSTRTTEAMPLFQLPRFSSPGLTAEDGPLRLSHLLAMEPTRPAPPSRYPQSHLGKQTGGCEVGWDGSLVFIKVLDSCLVITNPSCPFHAPFWATWGSLRGPSVSPKESPIWGTQTSPAQLSLRAA